MKPTAYTVTLRKGHAVARMTLRVVGRSGTPKCLVGTRGTLTLTDLGFAGAGGKASIRLTLPAACRITGGQWAARAGAIRPLP